MQAVNKKELEKIILDTLRIRDYTNKKLKGVRKFTKLSTNARVALEKGRFVFSFCILRALVYCSVLQQTC